MTNETLRFAPCPATPPPPHPHPIPHPGRCFFAFASGTNVSDHTGYLEMKATGRVPPPSFPLDIFKPLSPFPLAFTSSLCDFLFFVSFSFVVQRCCNTIARVHRSWSPTTARCGRLSQVSVVRRVEALRSRPCAGGARPTSRSSFH